MSVQKSNLYQRPNSCWYQGYASGSFIPIFLAAASSSLSFISQNGFTLFSKFFNQSSTEIYIKYCLNTQLEDWLLFYSTSAQKRLYRAEA